jgi:hypothetical protein
MAKKKTTKRTTKEAPSKKAASTPAPKVGALSAASQVLKAAKAPMTCGELIEAMAAKKLWVSPGGKTPANTLHAAITKEINTKGDASRFKKGERGQFEAA